MCGVALPRLRGEMTLCGKMMPWGKMTLWGKMTQKMVPLFHVFNLLYLTQQNFATLYTWMNKKHSHAQLKEKYLSVIFFQKIGK